jgi:hypothetical protein
MILEGQALGPQISLDVISDGGPQCFHAIPSSSPIHRGEGEKALDIV